MATGCGPAPAEYAPPCRSDPSSTSGAWRPTDKPASKTFLDILRNDIDATLLGLGRRPSSTELTPDDRVIPEGFSRALGVPNSHNRGHAFSAVVEDKLM